jgi:hypothetical protein
MSTPVNPGLTPYRENPIDSVSRLEQMMRPDSKWDLSENDQSAIRWALDTIKTQAPPPVLTTGAATDLGAAAIEVCKKLDSAQAEWAGRMGNAEMPLQIAIAGAIGFLSSLPHAMKHPKPVSKVDGLLPCPFCEGIPAIIHITAEEDANCGGYVVQCGKCLTSGPVLFACGEPVEDLLAEKWNRRPRAPKAPPDPPKGRDAVLIGCLLYLVDRILDAKTPEAIGIIHEMRTDNVICDALKRWRESGRAALPLSPEPSKGGNSAREAALLAASYDISWICAHVKANTIFDADLLLNNWNDMAAYIKACEALPPESETAKPTFSEFALKYIKDWANGPDVPIGAPKAPILELIRYFEMTAHPGAKPVAGDTVEGVAPDRVERMRAVLEECAETLKGNIVREDAKGKGWEIGTEMAVLVPWEDLLHVFTYIRRLNIALGESRAAIGKEASKP